MTLSRFDIFAVKVFFVPQDSVPLFVDMSGKPNFCDALITLQDGTIF